MPEVNTLAEAGLGSPGPLPHWADKHVAGKLERYVQLSTRDGRRFGNGIIVQVHIEHYGVEEVVFYVILTDFGNRVVLVEKDIERYFFPPEWRMHKALADFRSRSMEAYMALEAEVACVHT